MKIHLFYIIVILILTYINFKIREEFINKKTNMNITEMQLIQPSNVLKFNTFKDNGSKIIGFISADDCSTCYELLISELKSLLKLKNWNDKLLIMIVDKNGYSFKFREFLQNRYRIKMPIKIINLDDKRLKYIKSMKTPFLLNFDNESTITEILQINVGNQKYVYQYFDTLKSYTFR